MMPSLEVSGSIYLRYTRSQKRTYQNAMPKKTKTKAMKIRSSIRSPSTLRLSSLLTLTQPV